MKTKTVKQASKQASKQNSLTRLSLITLLISTSFYPVRSFAAAPQEINYSLSGGKVYADKFSIAIGVEAKAQGDNTKLSNLNRHICRSKCTRGIGFRGKF
ncbi:hypothetical protein QWV69_06710 [Neisseria gonorrhoeae]|uniref:hypothetical protein n=1 Tax=Neisseria gonorrhoeae TaxID=485 RepID=UPI001C845647|nr:hypothetical protein [Neisseria gonorrhoeae]